MFERSNITFERPPPDHFMSYAENHTKRCAPATPLSAAADRALHQFRAHTGATALGDVTGAQLLMERAWLAEFRFASGRSAGGHCRLLATADRTIAIHLARPSDWESIPAWLEVQDDRRWCWSSLADALRRRSATGLMERARLLGLAAAEVDAPMPQTPLARYFHFHGPAIGAASRSTEPVRARPLVVDLSALWAGPLCSHLLGLAGADVVKVESLNRPDGARLGCLPFYRLLNQGKRCVGLDLPGHAARHVLRELIGHADIVIESSRPRALRQLGIEPEARCAERPDLTWISITGYGRGEPQANWIAFGDDAGAAAGLSELMRKATGRYEFVGDAIADPLTGIHAALAAWTSWRSGGSRLISLALAEVAAAALAEESASLGARQLERVCAAWWADVQQPQRSPSAMRTSREPVGALGEHTDVVLAELGISC